MLTREKLLKLPKVELHRHLEGALDLQMLWELRQRYEPDRYKSFKAFKAACTIGRNARPGFKAFLGKFEPLRFHYGSLKNLERLVAASVWFSVLNESFTHLELRFSPVFFARRLLKGRAANSAVVPLSLTREAANAVIRGAGNSARTLTSSHSFIVTCARHFGYAVNKPTLDLLHDPIAKEIRGLDLAGDESVDATDFVGPFKEWKRAGKKITIHAGEDPSGPGPAGIIEALDVFGADRIGHGVRAVEDRKLVRWLAEEQVPLEICPTSSVQTRSVASKSKHPIKALLDAGICVTLNTDDPTICGTTLENEYLVAARMGLSFDELKRCAVNGARAAWLPFLIKDMNKDLARFIKKEWTAFPS